MRIQLLACLALTSIACVDGSARNVSAPESAVLLPGQQQRMANGPPTFSPGLGGRPIDGAGTPGRLASWATTSSLQDAPMRIDVTGDIVLKPGISLYVLTADGTKCVQIRGDGMTIHKVSGCPVVWQ